MTADPEDESQVDVPKGLGERARERLTLRYLIFVLPAVVYSVGVLVYYVVYGRVLEFLPAVFLLALVPVIALVGSSKETVRPWILSSP